MCKQGYIEIFLYLLKEKLENFIYKPKKVKTELYKNRPNNYSELKTYK